MGTPDLSPMSINTIIGCSYTPGLLLHAICVWAAYRVAEDETGS